jgi:hypothetical protein
MAPDSAEPARVVEGEVERAEAAHRDPAHSDPGLVPVVAIGDLRDHLVDDVGGPLAVRSVVPVGVVTAVGEGDDRRPAPELGQSCEELVDLFGVLVASSPVEEHEHGPWPIAVVTRRQHDVHGKASAHRLALDREVLDGRPRRVRPERVVHEAPRDDADHHQRHDRDQSPAPDCRWRVAMDPCVHRRNVMEGYGVSSACPRRRCSAGSNSESS